MYNKPKQNPRLVPFYVQGWQGHPDNLKDGKLRRAMKRVRVEAISPFMAAETYARLYQLPEVFWNSGSAFPPIVIRVE